jgi:hypothetical protein
VIFIRNAGELFSAKKVPPHPFKKALYKKGKKKLVSEQANGIFYIVGATIGRPQLFFYNSLSAWGLGGAHALATAKVSL